MDQKYLNVDIATPYRKKRIENVLSCSAPGILGQFQVLPKHTAFVSELKVGEVKIKSDDGIRYYAVSGGFAEILDDSVLLLLETVEGAEEIDIDRARQASERAAKRLKDKEVAIDTMRAEAALIRALNRLRVAQRASDTV